MTFLIDTNVAIHLRDRDVTIIKQVANLEGKVLLSIVSRVELEGGVYRDTDKAAGRRARLDLMLSVVPTVAFDNAAAETYGKIVAQSGYSRRKVMDRMIAAQALVHRATLVTMNAGDFADIPDLKLVAW